MAEDVKVPEGWDVSNLGKLASFINGYAFKPEDWKEEGLPIIRIEQLKDPNAKYDYSDKKLPDIYLIDNGDLIFSWSATLAIKLWDRGKAYLNQHLYKVIPNSTIKRRFLKYLLEHKIEDLSKETHGSTMKHITRTFLLNFRVTYPKSKLEQYKIAEILETVDNAIEKTGRIIEKYKHIKQGLMQDLLTRGIAESDELGVMSYELRDEKKHRFKDSPLGRIPEEWEVVELGCVGDIIYGEGLRQELYEPDGDTLVFGTGGIIGRAKLFLDRGPALVIPRKGSITSVFYIQEDQKFWIIDTAFYLKPQNGYCKFIYFTLCNMDLELLNEATGVPSLSRENIKSIQIPLPPLPEQHRIASLLSQIDEAIEKEQKYKEKLERIKKGLMEDLLMGKVRVNHLIGENKSLERVENV